MRSKQPRATTILHVVSEPGARDIWDYKVFFDVGFIEEKEKDRFLLLVTKGFIVDEVVSVKICRFLHIFTFDKDEASYELFNDDLFN